MRARSEGVAAAKWCSARLSSPPKYVHHTDAERKSASAADRTNVVSIGKSLAPIPMSTMLSPSATMISKLLRSTKCDGLS